MKDDLQQKFSACRRKKSSAEPEDCLLMLLTVLKQGGNWDFLVRMFNCKGHNFEQMILHFGNIVSPLFYENIIKSVQRRFTYYHIHDQCRPFTNYAHAQYATYLRFQHSLRPVGTILEAQPWYNTRILSDWIKAQNFFGRLISLWDVFQWWHPRAMENH